jgi:hypothetical protein
MVRRKKSELEVLLEASIRAAKARRFRKPVDDSLGRRLVSDYDDRPDSLADPDEFPLVHEDDDEDF